MKNYLHRTSCRFLKSRKGKTEINWHIFLFIIGLTVMTTGSGYAQVPITGQVTSVEDGSPIPGVTVILKNTNNGTITDINGNYKLNVEDSGGVLVFSFVGFVTEETTINNRSVIDISLVQDITELSEVVVVGYGTQKKTSLTASVATIQGEEITSAPVANLSTALGGRVPGLITRQGSGEPGQDAAGVLIRGIGSTGNTAPLVIVDGVPRGYNQIDPQTVESISFLKDAAAVAPYGVAGANGVILVTTKRGKSGKLQLSYNGYYGVQNPTVLPDIVNAQEYVTMRNVAAANANQQPAYNEYEIQKYTDGSEPDLYPNHDVLEEIVNRNAPMTSHSISASGGSENIKFFGSLGYLSQDGMWGPTNFTRYSLMSNIDAKVTNTTNFAISLNGRVEERNYPSVSARGIFDQLYRTPPIAPLSYTNDLWGSYIGKSAYGNIYASGYSKNRRPILLTQASLEQQLPIKGLSAKFVFSYDYNDSDGGLTKVWRTPIPYYGVDTTTTPYTYPQIGSDGPAKPEYSVSLFQRQAFTYQGFLNYNNNFGKSDVGATLVLEARTSKSESVNAGRTNYNVNTPELNLGGPAAADRTNGGFSSEARQRAIVFRATYGYDSKYLFEVSGRYDGHYVFAPGKRWNLFPAAAVGWRISEERFIKDNVAWMDNLKIRASYGESGALPYIGGSLAPFQYLSSYGIDGNSAVLGNSITQGVYETLEPNASITWETAKKTNLGFDLSIFRRLFFIEANYFFERRSDMLVSPQVLVPSEYGIGIAQENVGKMINRGIDFTAGSNFSVSEDLHVSLNVNFTYAKNELLEVFENEATRTNPNRTRTGRPLGTQFGYEALGLFQQSHDKDGNGIIESSEYPVQQFGTLKPGDIIYKDQNGDNMISGLDEVVIGNPTTPAIIYGFSSSVSYKGFDVNLLFQGAANQSFYLNGQAAYPFFNSGSALKSTLDYWTPENTDASYPRVLPVPSQNSTRQSSWWMRDGSYLRLKSAEIGYTLPAQALSFLNIQSIRLYLSGQNLLTWSKDMKNFDPEISVSNGSYYPQQKVITGGLNITF